jgi:hypothetical protein
MSSLDRRGFAGSPEFVRLLEQLSGARNPSSRPGEDDHSIRDLLSRPGDDDSVRDLLFRPERDGGYTYELLSGGPSFDLSYPKIPGRDLEGIPNANDPAMKRKLMERYLKNPGGQELPGFLKKV